MSEWIKCSDRLPEFSRVLVRTTTCGSLVASRCGEMDYDGKFIDGRWNWGVVNDVTLEPDEVTHWMPLPPPPGKPDDNYGEHF